VERFLFSSPALINVCGPWQIEPRRLWINPIVAKNIQKKVKKEVKKLAEARGMWFKTIIFPNNRPPPGGHRK
jgi:hypothetical protein